MNRCPKCGTNVKEGEAFCRMCGTKLPTPQESTLNNNQQMQANNQFFGNQQVNGNTGLQGTQPTQNTFVNNTFPQNNAFSNNDMLQSNNTFNNKTLQNNEYTNNSMMQNSTVNNMPQNSGYSNNSAQQNYGYATNGPQNSFINDKDLIDAYIGNNADKLKNGGFSINTFFFGVLYVLYRKMWLLGFVWLAINIIVSMFLPSISTYLTWGANIIISLQFKKLYLNHVTEEVNKIKIENPGKTNEQLMLICSQKGGTTLIPVILVGIIYAIMFFIAFTVIMGIMDEAKDKIKEQQDYYNNIGTKTLGNLSYKVPDILSENSFSTDKNKLYDFHSSTDSCSLRITTENPSAYSNDAKQFLEDSVSYSSTDTYSGITAKSLNKRSWYYAEVITDLTENYYYAILNNGKIYSIQFSILSDAGERCSKARDELASSLKLN